MILYVTASPMLSRCPLSLLGSRRRREVRIFFKLLSYPLLIIVDHCWSSLIIVDRCWSLLIIVYHCWSSLIIVDHYWSLLIIVDHCWLLFITVDRCWTHKCCWCCTHSHSDSTAGPPQYTKETIWFTVINVQSKIKCFSLTSSVEKFELVFVVIYLLSDAPIARTLLLLALPILELVSSSMAVLSANISIWFLKQRNGIQEATVQERNKKYWKSVYNQCASLI